MNNLVNFRMPVLQGKKEVVVGSKVSQREFDILQSICEREDRSMSYVLRELAIRGLAYYLIDGRLKTTPEEDLVIERSGGRVTSAHLKPVEVTEVPVVGIVTDGKTQKRRKAAK